MRIHRTQITTPRLLLRPFTLMDGDAVMAIAGDWHVARMTADLIHPMSAADAQLWLQPAPCDVRFAIQLAGEVIGSIGYYIDAAPGPEADDSAGGGFAPVSSQTVSAELGFFLARAAWGRGYAREAAGAVISHALARHSIAKFTASHFIDNAPSARVLSGLGFSASHRGMAWCAARGCDVDCICYRLDRSTAVHMNYSRAERDLAHRMNHPAAAGRVPVDNARVRQATRGQQ